MGYPENPIRLKIRDRMIYVLKNHIIRGEEYFFTPYEVVDNFVLWDECRGFPTYMIHTASGGNIVEVGRELYDETFYISIKGWVKDLKDATTALEKSVRDIRKAVNLDSLDFETSGSLGFLGVQVRIDEPPETLEGYLSGLGFEFFDQRIRCHISGDYGEL